MAVQTRTSTRDHDQAHVVERMMAKYSAHHDAPLRLPRKDSANSETALTLQADQHAEGILDIRDAGLSMNLASSIHSGMQEPHYNGMRTLPSLLLWNEQGLKDFEQVTYSPQYYLTNTEISLLEAYSQGIAQDIKSGSILLELGSGCPRKIRILLQAIDALGKSVDYYALDLDGNELRRSLRQLGTSNFKTVHCHGLLGTYDEGRAWLSKTENARRPRCVLSLGSTIGSFTRPEAAEFLSDWANTLRRRAGRKRDLPADDVQMIIGLDACKSESRVFGAYNDEGGANKRFIVNALDNANQQIGYNAFDLEQWTAQGEWDAEDGAHNQYLVPLKDVVFENVKLEQGERVFLVQSYKYDAVERRRLWEASGLNEVERYLTEDESYGLHVLTPSPPDSMVA